MASTSEGALGNYGPLPPHRCQLQHRSERPLAWVSAATLPRRRQTAPRLPRRCRWPCRNGLDGQQSAARASRCGTRKRPLRRQLREGRMSAELPARLRRAALGWPRCASSGHRARKDAARPTMRTRPIAIGWDEWGVAAQHPKPVIGARRSIPRAEQVAVAELTAGSRHPAQLHLPSQQGKRDEETGQRLAALTQCYGFRSPDRPRPRSAAP